jgi:hypothetical protein
MTPAQQHEVPDGRESAVGPMDHMVGVAPGLRPVAPREPAVTVAHDHGPANGGRDHRRPPSDVERLGSTREHHSHHRGVTGQSACHGPAHSARVIQLAEKDRVFA